MAQFLYNGSCIRSFCDSSHTMPADEKENVIKTRWPFNPSLNREVNNAAKMAGYCSVMLMAEVCKQITSYGMKYYNGGTYPFPQTVIVALAESLKFCVFLLITMFSESGIGNMKISWWYALPSIIYVVNNNIFYLALCYTTPPVWNILIQLRVLLTALTYRLFFKRAVTIIQWIALVLLVVVIALSKWTEYNSQNTTQKSHLMFALCLAVFGSVTSVLGSLVMEVQFTKILFFH